MRIIANGKQSTPPKTNYIKVKLDTNRGLSNALYLCWENNTFKWEGCIEHSLIIESKIDTNKYKYNTNLPKDQRNIPSALYYHKDHCTVIIFDTKSVSPAGSAILEY